MAPYQLKSQAKKTGEEMKRQQQLELGRELGEQLDSNSLDRVVSILIEWGLIEADLASQIIAEKVGA